MIHNPFKKIPIPEKIPASMEKKIKEFARSKDREEFLKKAFYYIAEKSRPKR